MTPIEKAARAMCAADGGWPDAMDGNPREAAFDWEHWKPLAIAAIRAIREPDEGMINAGLIAGLMRKPVWTAMIDSILSEEEAKP